MVGDYLSTSVRNGTNAYPIIGVADAPTGTTFDLAMYVPTGGMPITGGALRATTEGAAPAPTTAAVPATAN